MRARLGFLELVHGAILPNPGNAANAKSKPGFSSPAESTPTQSKQKKIKTTKLKRHDIRNLWHPSRSWRSFSSIRRGSGKFNRKEEERRRGTERSCGGEREAMKNEEEESRRRSNAVAFETSTAPRIWRDGSPRLGGGDDVENRQALAVWSASSCGQIEPFGGFGNICIYKTPFDNVPIFQFFC